LPQNFAFEEEIANFIVLILNFNLQNFYIEVKAFNILILYCLKHLVYSS